METTPFIIGAEARCSDGACGEVIRVVVDPVTETVTHLVVEPKHRQGLGRLVPLSLLDDTAAGIQLRCTLAEFGKLDLAEETQFLPGSRSYAQYGQGQVSAWPYYGLAGMGMGGGIMAGMAMEPKPQRSKILVISLILRFENLRSRASLPPLRARR